MTSPVEDEWPPTAAMIAALPELSAEERRQVERLEAFLQEQADSESESEYAEHELSDLDDLLSMVIRGKATFMVGSPRWHSWLDRMAYTHTPPHLRTGPTDRTFYVAAAWLVPGERLRLTLVRPPPRGVTAFLVNGRRGLRARIPPGYGPFAPIPCAPDVGLGLEGEPTGDRPPPRAFFGGTNLSRHLTVGTRALFQLHEDLRLYGPHLAAAAAEPAASPEWHLLPEASSLEEVLAVAAAEGRSRDRSCGRCSDGKTPPGYTLKCGHGFHAACITAWLEHTASSCPTCFRHCPQPLPDWWLEMLQAAEAAEASRF